jgi:hypothetical protein
MNYDTDLNSIQFSIVGREDSDPRKEMITLSLGWFILASEKSRA